MWEAIHKKTGKQYLAFLIWKKGLFENENVHDEEWLAPSDEIENYEELKEEIFVTPVIAHQRKNSRIPSFFRLFPKYGDRVILIKESEEHKKLKALVSVLLTEEFECSLKYDQETYLIKNLPVDYEKLQKNNKKIEVRKNITTTNEYKIADVLVPFIFNPFWGNGLIAEIRVSETEKTQSEKEDFWFQRGYSVIWVDEEDFVLEDGRIALNKNSFNVVPFSVGYKRILDKREERSHSLLHENIKKSDEIKKQIEYLKDEYRKSLNEIKAKYDDFISKIETKTIMDTINSEFEEKEGILRGMIETIDIDVFKDEIIEITTKEKNIFKSECEDFISEIHSFLSSSKKTCRTCIQGFPSKKNPYLIVCWKGTPWGKNSKTGHRRYPTEHEPLDGCEDYENY